MNVDLEIYSREDLRPLVDAFGKRVIDLYVGRPRRTYEAHLEVTAATRDPERTIRQFVRLIRKLPPQARRWWNEAKRREFNIGVQAGDTPNGWKLVLSPEIVKEAASLNACIGFTVYSAECPGARESTETESVLRSLLAARRLEGGSARRNPALPSPAEGTPPGPPASARLPRTGTTPGSKAPRARTPRTTPSSKKPPKR